MTLSIDTAVRGSRRLESLLEARLGAEGRGLHEKLSSVEGRVPEELRRSIRWIATMRNKVVHEDGPSPADADEFDRTVDRVARALEALGSGRESADKKPRATVDRPATIRKARPSERKSAATRPRKAKPQRPRKVARTSARRSAKTSRKRTSRPPRAAGPPPLRLTARGMIWLVAAAAITTALVAVATR